MQREEEEQGQRALSRYVANERGSRAFAGLDPELDHNGAWGGRLRYTMIHARKQASLTRSLGAASRDSHVLWSSYMHEVIIAGTGRSTKLL